MMDRQQLLILLKKYQSDFYPIVPFEPGSDKLLPLDFTDNNKELSDEILNDTNKFSEYITEQLRNTNCKYGIGGYAEHRTIYSRSRHFDSITNEEPRRLHLGVDIWGAVNTPVVAPFHGIVHSFAFNNNFGDYGATIILTHNLEGCIVHSLYGHLSLNSLKNLHEGLLIKRGDVFAEFGMQFENGHWPPHLHFQLIIDMENKKGDYPGVCKFSEKEIYLANSPDPGLMLSLFQKHQ